MDVESTYFIPLLIAPTIVLVGFVWFYFPPKKINSWYGYRTRMSMKSEQHWQFAQTFSGICMMVWGAIMGFVSGLGYLMLPNLLYGQIWAGLLLMLIFVFIPILQTERRLKRKFVVPFK